MWRQGHPKSKIETLVQAELQHRGAKDYQSDIIIIFNDKGIFVPKERATKKLVQTYGYTYPDGVFKKLRIAIYLDGAQVHRSRRIRMRDERIDQKLEEHNIKSLRFSYTAPVSQIRFLEICDTIFEEWKKARKRYFKKKNL